MAYFPDGSIYSYRRPLSEGAPPALNVGWLSGEHHFETAIPTELLLDDLWSFCRYSVFQMRGLHQCDFCAPEQAPQKLAGDRWSRPTRAWDELQSLALQAEYKGERLYLGSSEIRVLSNTGEIYAAPTLVFHYVAVHHYKPPMAFVEALRNGPGSGSSAHMALLGQIDKNHGMTDDWVERTLPRYIGDPE